MLASLPLMALLVCIGCRKNQKLASAVEEEAATDSVVEWKSGAEGDFSELLEELAQQARNRPLTLRIEFSDKVTQLQVQSLSQHRKLHGAEADPKVFHIRRSGYRLGEREIQSYPFQPGHLARKELQFALHQMVKAAEERGESPALLVQASRQFGEYSGMWGLRQMVESGVERMVLPDDPPQPAEGHPLHPLAQKIEAALPKGWSMHLGLDEIVVERDEPVHACALYAGMFDPLPGEEQTEQFWFALTSMGPMTLEEYADLKQRNEDLEKQGRAFHREAMIGEIPSDIDKASPWHLTYHPRNRAEAQAVARYKSIYRHIKVLPDLHLQGHAYRLDYPGGGFSFGDEAHHRECAKVFRRVSGFLFSFEQPPGPGEEVNPFSRIRKPLSDRFD